MSILVPDVGSGRTGCASSTQATGADWPSAEAAVTLAKEMAGFLQRFVISSSARHAYTLTCGDRATLNPRGKLTSSSSAFTAHESVTAFENQPSNLSNLHCPAVKLIFDGDKWACPPVVPLFFFSLFSRPRSENCGLFPRPAVSATV
jgi:hypothetical protein